MPFVEFSESDFLRGKIVTPAWYRVHIDNSTEALAKNGESTNYVMEGTIVRNSDDGTTDFTGVPLTWNFNSKAKGFMIGFFNALGVELAPGKRYELANSVGNEIDIFVENDTYDGRLINRINHKYRTAR